MPTKYCNNSGHYSGGSSDTDSKKHATPSPDDDELYSDTYRPPNPGSVAETPKASAQPEDTESSQEQPDESNPEE